MPKEISERVNKRNVVCMNCKHDFVSQVKEPICSRCNSTTIVDAKDIGDRMATIVLERKINEKLDHLESTVDEMRKSVNYVNKALEHIKEVQKTETSDIKQIVTEVWKHKKRLDGVSTPNDMDIRG